MSDYTVSFKLKQHTPMIHFQSDQRGATLRATELKPKLDRFLINRCPELPYKEHANGAKSLDYKVKITTGKSNVEEIEKINQRNGKSTPDPLFFGNMGEGKPKKFITSEEITLSFSSFNTQIIKTISEHLEAFLAQTNFGTRQSKGFGSFYLVKQPFNPSLIEHRVYSFNSTNWKQDIKLFYAFLRAGINTAEYGGIYAKAAIFAYAKAKGMTWDKKAIKTYFLNNDLQQQSRQYADTANPINYEGKKAYLVRDLFGLSSEQSWMSYKNATVKKGCNGIDRFKSPITFKVVDNTVYFWADKSVEKMLDKKFEIKFNNKDGLTLSTPNTFSFDDFFDFTFKLNLATYIEPRYHKDRKGEYQSLERIFKDIKENQ